MPLPPSPGSAEHVSIDLVNSETHLPGGTYDSLDTPETTTAWLNTWGLVGDGVSLQSYCQHRLTGLREDLRKGFVARAVGTDVDTRVIDRINAALVAAPNSSLLHYTSGGGFFRSLKHPATKLVEHAMSVIAEDAATLLSGETGALLAICEAEPCTRVFLKTHGRRKWCCTRCGDRVRAARAYTRKRATLMG